ncbi:MAG: hypothetical protein ACLFRD_10185 [Nitriliruptoraceae bacterium]
MLTNAGWRVNFRGGRPVAVRFRGELRTGTATLDENPDRVAAVYDDLIRKVGWKRAGQRLGIRINVELQPTHEELVEAARTYGLSVLRVDIGVQPPPA